MTRPWAGMCRGENCGRLLTFKLKKGCGKYLGEAENGLLFSDEGGVMGAILHRLCLSEMSCQPPVTRTTPSLESMS